MEIRRMSSELQAAKSRIKYLEYAKDVTKTTLLNSDF